MTTLKINDCVSLLNETGKFTVIEINGSQLVLKDEFGFERKVSKTIVCQTNPIEVKDLVKKDTELQKKFRSTFSNDLVTLDLHSEALEERGVFIGTNETILSVQLKEFKRFCNLMLDQRKTRFRVVHGIGAGVLRQEIRTLLINRKGFTVHDDQVSFGRVGASLVEVRLNEAQKF